MLCDPIEILFASLVFSLHLFSFFPNKGQTSKGNRWDKKVEADIEVLIIIK